MTMTCRDAESLLHDALDAPLPPADATALAAHLDTCGACRDLEADLRLLREATESLDPPIVSSASWTSLAAQLEREGLTFSGRRNRRFADLRWVGDDTATPRRRRPD
jgi:anti-sigma factor RsiW